MTPLMLLFTALPVGATDFIPSEFNASFDVPLGKGDDKVKDAVNDPVTKAGGQDYLDLMGIADAWSVQMSLPHKAIITFVADTGIYEDHVDLKNKLTIDMNGRHGYNFVDGAATSDITDSIGHGTFMSGIVAAQVNNGVCIAGVDPLARILTGKVSSGGTPNFVSAARAVDYAVHNGALIILMAFGRYFEGRDMQVLREAIQRAQSQEVFFVMSTDNNGLSQKRYPCAYQSPFSLCVGASQSKKRMLASYSNYGPFVDVAAPGDLVASTRIANEEAFGFATGTSASAAIVAGVVSMLLSVGIEPSQIKALILGTADPLDPYPGRFIGGGFVNASRAMRTGLNRPM